MEVHGLRDPYLTDIIHRLFKEGEKFNTTQLLQLRFITAVIRAGKCKVEDLPQGQSLDMIIAEWEKNKIIGLQESLMKKRDSDNIKIILEGNQVESVEHMNIKGVLELNATLSDYECKNFGCKGFEECKLQKEYFRKLVDKVCDDRTEYELKQFYQLRYITAVAIKTGKSKIDKMSSGKSPQQIIDDWETTKIIGLQEESMRERDQLTLNVISELQKIDLTKLMDIDALLDLNCSLGIYTKGPDRCMPQDSYFEKVALRLGGNYETARYNLTRCAR